MLFLLLCLCAVARAGELEVWVPRDARPGDYEGALAVQAGTTKKTVPIRVRVYDAAAPKNCHLDTVYWANWAWLPDRYRRNPGLREQYWRRMLLDMVARRQNVVVLPVFNRRGWYPEDPVKIIEENGAYRLARMAFDAGMEHLTLGHLCRRTGGWNGKYIVSFPMTVYGPDGRKKRELPGPDCHSPEFKDIFGKILPLLYWHLEAKGWRRRVLFQHLADGPLPNTVPAYNHAVRVLKEAVPGLRAHQLAGNHQPALRGMDRGAGQRAAHGSPARPPHPSHPYPRGQRRELPPARVEATTQAAHENTGRTKHVVGELDTSRVAGYPCPRRRAIRPPPAALFNRLSHVHVTITVRNRTSQPVQGRLSAFVESASDGETINSTASDCTFAAGDSTHRIELAVGQPRLWSLDDPFLYRVLVPMEARAGRIGAIAHHQSVRFGFRDFRVRNGFFYLNGTRIFLKSTHAGDHFPIGQVVPHDPDFMRRDLIHAKACGFNMLRFIAGVAWPEQLDCCDEIGLMVCEENLAGWCLEDSPKMAERYDSSTRAMILRDRNHPSVTIWGLLNETPDNAVFRHAAGALGWIRDLDDSRLVLLNSGRWDCDPSTGSVCNPGGRKWEHQWGIERPWAKKVANTGNPLAGGYFQDAGDAHTYPAVPLTGTFKSLLRELGKGQKPVFLSELGTGSLFNVVDECRKLEEVGARADLPDLALIRSMRDKLAADWKRYGMEEVYPFLGDSLRDSYRLHIRERRINFDLVRSNPNLCGYNVTGMLDHGITGEGLWTFWREWKPGIADVLRDGWAPLRWCLFVTPEHGYAGRKVRLEAVLANEEVLAPGDYPVRFRVAGPAGLAWERRTTVTAPRPRRGKPGPFAIPVLLEEVKLGGPSGEYTFAASLQRGGAPMGDRKPFRLADDAALPEVGCKVTAWGLSPKIIRWLGQHGVRSSSLRQRDPRKPELILAGDPARCGIDEWREVMRRVARGGAVVAVKKE